MTKVTKTFIGLGSAILMTDSHGNKTLQIDSLYCPVSYIVGTDKGMAMVENYLALDKALYTGAGGQPLSMEARMDKWAAIDARARTLA